VELLRRNGLSVEKRLKLVPGNHELVPVLERGSLHALTVEERPIRAVEIFDENLVGEKNLTVLLRNLGGVENHLAIFRSAEKGRRLSDGHELSGKG